MWISWLIDFIITFVSTIAILVSRAKHDGHEYAYTLSGGSHMGTTVLMIMFWVICVIHFIICVIRSAPAEQQTQGKTNGNIFKELHESKRIEDKYSIEVKKQDIEETMKIIKQETKDSV